MPSLNRNQLRDIASAANALLTGARDGTINGGIVRAVVEALEGAGYRVEPGTPLPTQAQPEAARAAPRGLPDWTDRYSELMHAGRYMEAAALVMEMAETDGPGAAQASVEPEERN